MGNCKSCFNNNRGQLTELERQQVTDPLITPKPKNDKVQKKEDITRFSTSIDCGGEDNDHESLENVTIYGPLSMRKNSPSTVINGSNVQYKEFAKSFRWSAKSFGYNVLVPRPGIFKVTLVFCEIDKASFATGKRVFSASILGNERVDINDIDVFSKSGKNSPYILNIDNVHADSRISIVLRKGTAGNPFISGISIQTMKWSSSNFEQPSIGEPKYTVSKSLYMGCEQRISEYSDKLRKSGNQKLRTAPTYMFHQAETKVRGLIVTFHSFSSTQYEFRIFNRLVGGFPILPQLDLLTL